MTGLVDAGSSSKRMQPEPAGELRSPNEAHERLVRQLREANEKLIVATVHAERLAEIAIESEERFRSLVLASAAIVWRADARGQTSVEPAARLGVTGARAAAIEPAEASTDWLDAVHPLDRERVQCLWSLAVATSTPFECEHRLCREAGSDAWVASRGVPILRNGVAREWIGMMTDISKRVEMEQAREQFIAVLGHDLRGPLAAVSICAEALRQLQLGSPYGLMVDEIGRTTKRMASLTSDVMDFAQGRMGGGISLVGARCELGSVCAEVVAEIRRVHPARVIRLKATGDLQGEWDAGRLGQVMANLVTNAVTHGQDPIAVRIAGSADEIALHVSSHGPPILPHVLATLFEPFTRAGMSPVGLGLGLFIVSEIVHAYDGTVDVTSDHDATMFTVRIPRAAG